MKRRLRFHEWMLRGHPGDITRAVKRVIVRGHNHGLIVTSTTDGKHAPTSFHFTEPGQAVDLGNKLRCRRGGCVGAVPGTVKARKLMVEFQRFLVEKFGCAAFHELYGPNNRLNCRKGRRVTLDEGSALEENHDSHVHVVPAKVLPWPLTRAARARISRESLILRAQTNGAKHVRKIFEAADKHNIGYALALALFQHESNFLNQYGHDRDSRGRIIWHGQTGQVMVTEENYRTYKRWRYKHGLAQGVGLGQLTSPVYQDLADARGGCWKTSVNVDVSLEVLAGHIKALGRRQGVGAYNGGRGNPQLGYADAVLAKRDAWVKVLYPERNK